MIAVQKKKIKQKKLCLIFMMTVLFNGIDYMLEINLS